MAYPSPLQEAADRLIPLQQGKLDNLCGLYSILNAIRLASWPTLELHHYRSRQLFDHGIALLERDGMLRQVLKQGMPEKTWIWLCRALLREANRLNGGNLQRVPILEKVGRTDTPTAFARIGQHTRRGEPVMVTLRGGYNHYTVVVECTATRLKLFDSYGYRWVSLASCELHHRHATLRHRIPRASAACLQQAV